MGHPIQQRVTEQAVLAGTPFALVFASKFQRIIAAPLLEPGGADTGTVPGGNLKARPISKAVPGLVKKSLLQEGRRQQRDPASRCGGEHWQNGRVCLVEHKGGFVYDNQARRRKSADRLRVMTGQRHDAGLGPGEGDAQLLRFLELFVRLDATQKGTDLDGELSGLPL